MTFTCRVHSASVHSHSNFHTIIKFFYIMRIVFRNLHEDKSTLMSHETLFFGIAIA